MHDSANILGFNISYTVNELNEASEELLKLNNYQDAYLRILAWHGSESLSFSSSKNSVNVAIAVWQWKYYFASKDIGLKLMWSDWVRPAPNMAPVHAKASEQYIYWHIR